MKHFIIALFALATSSFAAAAEPDGDQIAINPEGKFYSLAAHYEIGFLAPLNTRFNIRKTVRWSITLRTGGKTTFSPSIDFLDWLVGKNTFVLLYQPLDIQTEVNARQDYVIENERFSKGEPMRFRFSFPFSEGHTSTTFSNDPSLDLEIGGSLQLRNARIEFATLDGERFRSSRDVGPVPLMKLRVKKNRGIRVVVRLGNGRKLCCGGLLERR